MLLPYAPISDTALKSIRLCTIGPREITAAFWLAISCSFYVHDPARRHSDAWIEIHIFFSLRAHWTGNPMEPGISPNQRLRINGTTVYAFKSPRLLTYQQFLRV